MDPGFLTDFHCWYVSKWYSASGLTVITQDPQVAVLAYNCHEVTEACLDRVRHSGFEGDLVLVDNGSDPAFENIAERYDCRLIRNDVNRYVNPVWNRLFQTCERRFLTLLNNDCLVRDQYLNEVVSIMQENDAALAAPSFEFVEALMPHDYDFSEETASPRVDESADRAGYLMTIDLDRYLDCDFLIPKKFRIWYGDDWIWGQLRANGQTCVRIENRTCWAERSATISRHPHLQAITTRERRSAPGSPSMRQAARLARKSFESEYQSWAERNTIGGVIRRLRRVSRRWVTVLLARLRSEGQ
ncbi:MAG: glycosyltransferase family 2 protein [Longimicrobiales bacterium]